MLSAAENDRITRVGPDRPADKLLRRYRQPAALVDELANGRPISPLAVPDLARPSWSTFCE